VVRESLQRLHEVLETEAFDPVAADHSFTIAMADATAALFVPVLVAALQRQRSGVNLFFLPLNTRDPRPLLEQGQADAAVGFFPEVNAALQVEGAESATRNQALYACRYVCVMRRDHPLAQPGALTLQAYCAAQHVRVSFAGRARGFVDESLVGTGPQAPRAGHGEPVLHRRLGRAEHGLVDRAAAQLRARHRLPGSTGGELNCLLTCAGIDVGLLWHARHDRSPAHRWLRQALARAAAEIAPSAATSRAPLGRVIWSSCASTRLAGQRTWVAAARPPW
jgi:DNA-binding transcriptional LysR family regulator